MHALIIEDEPLIALLIEDHLRSIGYLSIDFAVTEADAVAAARRRCPDLITSDVRLETGCGIAAVETICGEREIQVIFITAHPQEVRRRAADATVIAKPFTAGDLRQALGSAPSA